MRRSGSYYGATASGELTNDDREQARTLAARRHPRRGVVVTTEEAPEEVADAPDASRRTRRTPARSRASAASRCSRAAVGRVARALTLLAVRPPAAEWFVPSAVVAPAYWIILDAADARLLPEPWATPLALDGFRRARADGAELTVLTVEGCAALLAASTRRAFEARWTLRHAEPLHDPLARHEAMAAAAARLEVDALERAVRALYLQLFVALDALPHADPASPVAAGEAAGAAARLACLLDEGSYPPAEWLFAAARATRRDRWLRPWLTALAGDEDARRHAALTAPEVLREFTSALRARFANRPWLQDPERYALRPPRGRD